MSGEAGFVDLWPTTLLQRVIPSSAGANLALAELLLHLDEEHAATSASSAKANLTADYLEQNLLDLDHPAIEWLAACINKTVADYLSRTGVSIDVSWQLQVWANINRTGDYHNLHNHPHSYLSGTYYVQVPDEADVALGTRTDLNANAISFYDPRPQSNMTAVAGDPQIDPEYRVLPEAGLVMLWPSFLHHLVHPNLASATRISISFNVVLERKSG